MIEWWFWKFELGGGIFFLGEFLSLGAQGLVALARCCYRQ